MTSFATTKGGNNITVLVCNFIQTVNYEVNQNQVLSSKKYTVASDVWAFGILFWEILTFCERPYNAYNLDGEVNSVLIVSANDQ